MKSDVSLVLVSSNVIGPLPFRLLHKLCHFAYLILLHFSKHVIDNLPIPVAARPKGWYCSRSLAGIAGSNPAGSMDVCLL